MSHLTKIRNAGFTVALEGEFIEVSPPGALTTTQRQFLKANKAAIVQELQAEASQSAANQPGVLSPPDREAILNWLAFIGEDDPIVIIDTLTRCQSDSEALAYFLARTKEGLEDANDLKTAITEAVEERAAIMEFDAGLPRKDAEQAAESAMRVYQYRIKEKPERDLVAIMPGLNLAEAEESLKIRYADRLISVKPMEL